VTRIIAVTFIIVIFGTMIGMLIFLLNEELEPEEADDGSHVQPDE
jgi:hypothetical protein